MNRMTLRLLYLLSAGCIGFLMLFGNVNLTSQLSIKSDYSTGAINAGFTPGITDRFVESDDTLHIHFISGSDEYQSEKSLKKLGKYLEDNYKRIRVTASWGEDAGEELPDIDQLAEADLMFVFTRRMRLPEDQLEYILDHVRDEKPVIGIRTASHAFQGFLELDSSVFGGNYDGHGDDESVELSYAETADAHPILKDVNLWERSGKIYHNPDLGSNTEVLLYGEGRESTIYEPLAWTNRYGQTGRAFYTSMGLPEDFENENFLRLLVNAIPWSVQQELQSNEETEVRSSDTEEQKGSYQSMDYGPVLAESIRMNWPEGSLVRKGMAIHLDHNASVIFDTDLVRFAAGTADGWLDITDTDYMSYKGSDIARIEGRQVFSTSEIAGWAKDGSFYGPREDGMGNLPHEWAHYKGYYRYGDQVVLSYTVGELDVLELPASMERDGSLIFTRTMQLSGTDTPQKALVLEKTGSWQIVRNSGRQIIIDTGDTVLAILLTNASDGVRLAEGGDERIELHLPPSGQTESIRVAILEMQSPDKNLIQDVHEQLLNEEVPHLQTMARGGPAHWDEQIKTPGILSDEASGYVIDRIPVPFDNPWGAWMRLSGLDFFEDGTRAAVSTWNGDVWIVSGIDESLEDVRWQRFASGLFYPMGVVVKDGDIYVTERSQLTRLHDLNGNGEADYYENFNNDGIVFPMAHTLELQVDSNGNFYFFKNGNRVPGEIPEHGALIRVSADGSQREVYARGYRGANSLGIGPDDRIVGADQEGNWVPVDRIDIMERDGFYGDRRHGGENLEVGEFDPPVAWTPKVVNNSSGLITYVGDSRWGPLAGQWVLGSYGQRSLFAILMEELNGRYQGGIVKLPVESTSGLMRGRVNPGDGQLYVVGLRGWQTLATDDASFERIRFTGGNANLPKSIRASSNGVEIVFTDPVEAESARDIDNYQVERWDYIYSSRYGSPEVLPNDPDIEGREAVEISSVSISDNGRNVFLEITDMRSVMQMEIGYKLLFDDGQLTENAIYHTVNWLSEEEAINKPEWQQRIISQAGESDEEFAIQQEESLIEEEDTPDWYQRGAISFQRNCAACHVRGGTAPSMEDSEWAGKSHEALVRIILQGKRGSRGVMTPFAWLDNEELASVVSYIRRQWHGKEPVNASQIEQIRRSTDERTALWTDEELKKLFKK